MFSLSKLKDNKCFVNKKKKSKPNKDRDNNSVNTKRKSSTGCNTNKKTKLNSSLSEKWTDVDKSCNDKNNTEFGENYRLNYIQESGFFAKNSIESVEMISQINSKLNDVHSRTYCLKMLDVIVDSCNDDCLNRSSGHWSTALLHILTSSVTSQSEKEVSCDLLTRVVSRLQPSHDTSHLLTSLTCYITGKWPGNENNDSEAYLFLKLKLLNGCLASLPTMCGQNREKFESLLFSLIAHGNMDVQELAATCLARLPGTGRGGATGQPYHEAWSKMVENILTQTIKALSAFENEFNKGNKQMKEVVTPLLQLVSKITGLVKTLLCLLEQPSAGLLDMKLIIGVVITILDFQMKKGENSAYGISPYLLHLHKLAFSVLESLLSKYSEFLSIHSNVIFNCMNEALNDMGQKGSEEPPKFCTVRRTVYVCLRHCFLNSIFPTDMVSLKTVIEAAIADCNFPVLAQTVDFSSADKMKLSSMSKDVYSKKKRKRGQPDAYQNDLDRLDCKVGRATNEEMDMCVAALEALNSLIISDSKLLLWTVLSEDNTVRPLRSSDNSKQKSLLTILATPIWKSLIPLVGALQRYWALDSICPSSRSSSVYDAPEVKVALYRLLSSLISLPLFRESHLCRSAHQMIRSASGPQSPSEVQQICKQTLMWINLTASNIPVTHSQVVSTDNITMATGEDGEKEKDGGGGDNDDERNDATKNSTSLTESLNFSLIESGYDEDKRKDDDGGGDDDDCDCASEEAVAGDEEEDEEGAYNDADDILMDVSSSVDDETDDVVEKCEINDTFYGKDQPGETIQPENHPTGTDSIHLRSEKEFNNVAVASDMVIKANSERRDPPVGSSVAASEKIKSDDDNDVDDDEIPDLKRRRIDNEDVTLSEGDNKKELISVKEDEDWSKESGAVASFQVPVSLEDPSMVKLIPCEEVSSTLVLD